jgi:ankyrin
VQTAIHNITQAAARGDVEAVRALLRRDRALANVTGQDGWPPLHLASRNGHEKVAAMLLDHGASLQLRSSNALESQPLHAAAAGGQTALVRLLLERGAKVDARQRDGRTALHIAAQAGLDAMVALLLEAGAEVDVKSDDGLTPLDWALSHDDHAVAQRLRRRGGKGDGFGQGV